MCDRLRLQIHPETMLRLLVLILILANGVYFAWSAGLLQAAGFAPAQQQEPQRLAQQVRPEALRVLTPQELKRVEAQVQADLAPRECLQAGPFDDAQAGVLRHALESAIPPGSWQLDTVAVPARWIVYMGKFASAEGVAKKREELAAMRLVPQSLINPALEIGLSLGAFDNQAAANAELARLNLRGIRTNARANAILTIGMSAVLVAFFITAVGYIVRLSGFAGLFSTQPFYDPATFSWPLLSTGTSIAVLTYMGFDSISTLSEDVENPKRTIPLATILLCVITGILGCLEVYAGQLIWPDFRTFPDQDTAFVSAAAS